MCRNLQPPAPISLGSDQEPSEKSLDSLDEPSRVIAAADVILKGLNEKAGGHWELRGGPG
jgi:hypothetical protein